MKIALCCIRTAVNEYPYKQHFCNIRVTLIKVKNVKLSHFLFSVESTSPLFYRLKCKYLIERDLQILFLNLHARLNQIGIFNRVKTVLFIFNLFLYKTQFSLQEIEFSMQQIVLFTTQFYRFLTSHCVFLLYLL